LFRSRSAVPCTQALLVARADVPLCPLLADETPKLSAAIATATAGITAEGVRMFMVPPFVSLPLSCSRPDERRPLVADVPVATGLRTAGSRTTLDVSLPPFRSG